MKSSAILIFALATAGCVSVNLGKSAPKHASGVHYNAPASPFESDDRDDVDAAWKNPSNGNLISFLSDCQDETDPSLDTIVDGAIGSLTDLKIESQHNPMFEGRGSRRVVATGKVDGVPSKIDLLAFKRNRCIYILTYVGVPDSFDSNHADFEKFIEGFRAP